MVVLDQASQSTYSTSYLMTFVFLELAVLGITRDRVINIVAVVATIIGLISAYLSSFDLFRHYFNKSDKAYSAEWFVVIFALLAIVAAVIREWQTSRKEKYANITPKLHRVSHELRDLHSHIQHNAPAADASDTEKKKFIEECKREFSVVLDYIVGIFEMLTSTKCRAAIKIITQHSDGKYYVDTLTRNKEAKQDERDNWRIEHNIDLLEKNREFGRMFCKDEHEYYFFCNNLATKNNFTTTSVAAYDREDEINVRQREWLDRVSRDGWKLPYRSTITCAIRQTPHHGLDGKPEAVGFLAIDSESSNVFTEKWDKELGFSFADAIFLPLDKVMEIMNIYDENN